MKTGWRNEGNVERRQCGFPSRVPFLALLPSLLLWATLSTTTKNTIMNELIFTARKRSLGQRNLFCTCLLFCSQGGGGLLPPPVVRPPFRCRPPECRSPLDAEPPWMQNPLDVDPSDAGPLGGTPPDADHPVGRSPRCRPPWMQTSQMQTPS